MEDKNLSRIAALLRKAERTDNEHEADAYLQAAQRIATLASVDLAVARAHAADQEVRAAPTQRTVTIGEAGKRGLRTYVQLFLAIGRANDLICDIARNSTLVFAYGFASDIDAAEALYASLVVQMVRASDHFIKSGVFADELVIREVREVVPHRRWGHPTVRRTREARPVHATTARINFQDAFALRIGQRLQEARDAARAEAMSGDTTVARSGSARSGAAASTAGVALGSRPGATATAGPPAEMVGVALVLRDREVELIDHYRSQSKARGSWSGSRANAGYSALSRQAGDQAGRQARLGGERAIGGQRPALHG